MPFMRFAGYFSFHAASRDDAIITPFFMLYMSWLLLSLLPSSSTVTS